MSRPTFIDSRTVASIVYSTMTIVRRTHRLAMVVASLLILPAICAQALSPAMTTPAEDLAAKMPDQTLGFFATSGTDHIQSAFDASSVGKIWHEPSVQAFYQAIKKQLLAKLEGQMDEPKKQAFHAGIALARQIVRNPMIVAAGRSDPNDPTATYGCFVLCAGPRKDALEQALQDLLKAVPEAPPLEIGPYTTTQPAERGAPLIGWGWVNDHFVSAVNDPKAHVAQAVGKPTTSRPAPIQTLRQIPATDDLAILYLDLPAIAKTVADAIKRTDPGDAAKIFPKAQQVLSDLGLSRIGVCAARDGFDGNDIVSNALLEIPAPRTGLFAHLKPIRLADLDLIDAQACGVTIVNIDLAGVYDTVMQTIKNATGVQFEKIQAQIATAEQNIGFSLQADLFEAIGGNVITAEYAPGTGAMTLFGGSVLIADLKKPEAFEKAMVALGNMYAELSKGQLQVASQVTDERTIHTWTIPTVAMLGINYCWTTEDNRLILGTNMALLNQTIARLARTDLATDSIRSTESFKRATRNLPDKLISFAYGNSKAKTQSLLTLAQSFWPMIVMVAKQNADIDLPPMLPPTADIVKHLDYRYEYSWFDDRGLRSHSRGSLSSSNVAVAGAAIGMGSAMLVPSISRARKQAKRAVSASNLHQIGMACMMYANDQQGKFPADLNALVKSYIQPEVLDSPRKPDNFTGPSYLYIPGHSTDSAPDLILAYENPVFSAEGTNVLYTDGHVAWVHRDKFITELKTTCDHLKRPMPDVQFKSPTTSPFPRSFSLERLLKATTQPAGPD